MYNANKISSSRKQVSDLQEAMRRRLTNKTYSPSPTDVLYSKRRKVTKDDSNGVR